jgi:MFS family permease
VIEASRVGGAFAHAAHVLVSVFRSPALRRVGLAYAGFNLAEWAVWVAILVYAYGQGGTTEVGVVALVMLLPAALVAPLGSVLGDRHRAGRVLFWGYLAQAAALAVTAAVMVADGPTLAVYAAATVASATVTSTRPTMSAYTPSLARTPEELTAVNVVSSWVESASVLVAPSIAGVLLAVSGTAAVMIAMCAVLLVSALLVYGKPGPPPAGTADDRVAVVASVAAGFDVLRRERAARLLMILMCADFVALGALDVLYPELAIGVLDRSESWAGYLNAAFGAGATVGVVLTASMVGRPRLMPTMLLGLSLYVVSFVLLAFYPTVGTALLLLALAGAGRVVLDVGARTLLQRVAPSDVLARVFGLLEGLAFLALALGSLLVAGLVALGGATLGIVGVGLLLPLAAAAAGRGLLDIDRHATVPVVEIGLLRGLPLFAALGPATLEALARALERTDVAAGADVIRQGDDGDRFYVIADGAIEVIRDGTTVTTLGRGDGFGEIALLHAVPRTATCRAATGATLYALDADTFLTAVTGHPHAHAAARDLAASRLLPSWH